MVDRAASASDSSPRTPTTPLLIVSTLARVVPERERCARVPQTRTFLLGYHVGRDVIHEKPNRPGTWLAIAVARGPVDR
ncbi:hypothetical protein [Dictyobacter halimunensis]|uniref:hypothetical protein n=1 Tax=Dictyobacter halimunensis TaxID=3026934 RepID=UPI0030C65DA3